MRTLRLPYSSSRGFSLMELIVVVAIVGLLLSVAMPFLGGYMVKSKRQDATALLFRTVQRLEQCFTLEGVYNGSCALKLTSPEGYYSLNASRDAQTYTLHAVPVEGKSQANDSDCATLTITSTGKKSATGTLGALCW